MPRAAAKTTATKVMAAWEPAAPGLWFCNWKIWLEARRRLDRALAPLGLRAREFWLLAIAGRGNVSQHEIANLCGLDPSSLVAVLDGLERRGWLRRSATRATAACIGCSAPRPATACSPGRCHAPNAPRRGSWPCFPRPISASWWPPCANW